jgi:hypothetical protein
MDRILLSSWSGSSLNMPTASSKRVARSPFIAKRGWGEPELCECLSMFDAERQAELLLVRLWCAGLEVNPSDSLCNLFFQLIACASIPLINSLPHIQTWFRRQRSHRSHEAHSSWYGGRAATGLAC